MQIRSGAAEDARWLQESFARGMGHAKREGYFAARLDEQLQGAVVVIVAEADDGRYVGHAIVRWESAYPAFRDSAIPETTDLNVIAAARRQGVGSAIMDRAEAVIGQRSQTAGIGVGLYADYGSAQRLYVRRGYLPDGAGAMSHNRPVTPGQQTVVDDGLVLYLTKHLGASAQ